MLVTDETFKEGDIVLCINSGGFGDQITEGITYTVTHTSNNTTFIFNDNGDIDWYDTTRFVISAITKRNEIINEILS